MKATVLATLLTLLAIGGCVRPPIEGRQDPYTPAQVHFDSQRLRKDTAIGAPVLSRDAGGILHVSLPIRSAINKTLYVDYRISFFDRHGQRIGSQLGPFTKTLDPNTPDTIVMNSTSPEAADFQIDLRYAR